MRAWVLLLTLLSSVAFAAPAIKAPRSAKVGSILSLEVTGSSDRRDFVTVVKKGSREGAYDAYVYVTGGTLQLQMPGTPGDYELRVLGAASPYPTLAKQDIKIEGSSATVKAATTVKAGAEFEVAWTGPNNPRDYIAIGDANQKYLDYKYTRGGSPVKITAPDKAGEYEVRYILGEGDVVIATQKVTIGATSASLAVPAQVSAGASVPVTWHGPGNPRDYLTIVKSGAPEQTYDRYEYVAKGNPVTLIAPDAPGDYEVRYLSARDNLTLARAKLTVGAITGSISGPAQVVAGESFKVSWNGPDNPRNFITVVPKNAREGEYSSLYSFTTPQTNPVTLLAPLQPGDYELRYSTAQNYYTIARASLKVTPSKQEPGLIAVTFAPGTKPANGAIEIILDASGSMLQKLGSARRIDIAKQTLTKLTSSTIPAGTPFAMRVFGREVDSCQTDLDVPVSPLNPATAGQRIAALGAKNGAKTPIGASLAKAADDLKSVKGEKLIVLITDGEETCGGDPAGEIEKLRKVGIGTRVSIVGFALDDEKLAATFRRWSDLGGGAFFDAKDAAGLEKSMNAALRPGFEVLNAQGQVVASGIVGGETVAAPSGSYTVRIKGRDDAKKAVEVKPKETTSLEL
ncbi:MAG TPA: VWA domain-containing protein [Steroidobacteraceae bacterium]|nr:VWA domain-containing protein [Steroidobacteraceae bacterium]